MIVKSLAQFLNNNNCMLWNILSHAKIVSGFDICCLMFGKFTKKVTRIGWIKQRDTKYIKLHIYWKDKVKQEECYLSTSQSNLMVKGDFFYLFSSSSIIFIF